MKVLLRAEITYDVASGGTTHAPLALVSVGSLPEARFVLDTGSDVHLFTEDLADELGLDKQPGEEGTDHTGATMPSWTVGDVPAQLAGVPLTLRDVVVIPAPSLFAGYGIRGILSPQHLHPPAVTVIDMANDELLLVEGGDAEVRELIRARAPTLELLSLDREAESASVVVSASVEPFGEVRTLIDSGGKRTEFALPALPGISSHDESRLGGGVFGGEYRGGSAGRQTLLIGGLRLAVPNLAVRETMPDTDGIVSMDVLRGTIVACGADRARPVFVAARTTAS